jgi:quinol monooxygenase YgiN
MPTLGRAWPHLALLILLALPQGFSASAPLPQPQNPPSAATSPAAAPRGDFYVLTFIDVLGQYESPANALCRQYIADSRSDTGLVRLQALAQTDGRQNHIMLFAEWKSRKNFEGHQAMAHTKRFREQLLPYLGAPFDERYSYEIPAN